MMQNRKGFTLAELLIVVAILGVLVSIAVVTFSSSLERTRETADLSNVRSALINVVNHYYGEKEIITERVKVQQRVAGWQMDPTPTLQILGFAPFTFTAKTSGEYEVTIEVAPVTQEVTVVIR